jgi:hypothetical protein
MSNNRLGVVSCFQSCPHDAGVIATMAETGKVHVFDMSAHIQHLDNVRYRLHTHVCSFCGDVPAVDSHIDFTRAVYVCVTNSIQAPCVCVARQHTCADNEANLHV